MFDIVFKIWYLIAILPFIILIEGSKRFSAYLKKKDYYHHWDMWHTVVVVLILFALILTLNGYGF